MKKRAFALLFVLITLACAFPVSAVAADKPVIAAGKTIVVYNIETAQFIENTAGGKVLSPANSVKLMTAMVVYDTIKDLSTVVTAPDFVSKAKYIGQGGVSAPSVGLTPGSQHSARAYLETMLVSGANDAAVSLANHAGNGNIDDFVALMNKKAAELGAANTHYTNCTGVYDENMTTTAEDTAKIAAAFYMYNDLVAIASSAKATNTLGSFHTKNYLNSDSLLQGYKKSGTIGLSAGQLTESSGYCLIAAAEKTGLTYIFVIMEGSAEQRNAQTGERRFDTGSAYDDMTAIVPWAVSGFSYAMILSKQSWIEELPVSFSVKADYVIVVPESDVECLLPTSVDAEKDIVLKTTWLYESLNAPVEKGLKVGEISVMHGETVIAVIPIVTNDSVKESMLLTIGYQIHRFLKSSAVLTVIKVFIILAAAYAAFSLVMFILRVIRKFIRGAKSKNEYTDDDFPDE